MKSKRFNADADRCYHCFEKGHTGRNCPRKTTLQKLAY